MRAVVGGTVTEVEPWEFADRKTGEMKRNSRVYILSGRYVDVVVVPSTVAGPPTPGSEVFYVANINADAWQGRARLKVWAESVYEGNPFAVKPTAVAKAS